MLIELMVELFQPYMMSRIIDDGIIAGQFQSIALWGGLLLGSTFLAFGVGILSSFFSAYVSQNFGFDIREALYRTVQSFTYAVFSRFQEASLMTRMTNDVNQLQNVVFMGLRIMMRAPLLVIGSMVMAFVINPSLAIYLLISLPILILFLIWVMQRNNKLFRQVQARLDNVNRVMQQSLIGMRLIRVFGRMNYENGRFNEESNQLKQRTISTLRLAELTMPVILVLINGSILLVLWFGREALLAGNMTSVGDIVAIVNYAMRISGALSMLSMIVMNISRATASASRIEEVFQASDNDEDVTAQTYGNGNIQGDISFRNVSFKYPDIEQNTLNQMSFEVKNGEMIAIMGATGSGKSSLLQLIPKMYDTSSGDIYVDYKSLKQYELPVLRRAIGYVPQEVLLFSGTVADNIRWGKKEATFEEVVEAAKMAQIHDTIMKLPNGYDTLIGQKGVNLSGGQKQRMTIARALVRKPQILLLDDCTSALDVQTENLLLAEIRKLSCTVFLVTQKMSSTLLADRILILDDGELIADGKHEELLQKSKLYQRIHQSQTREKGGKVWETSINQVAISKVQ